MGSVVYMCKWYMMIKYVKLIYIIFIITFRNRKV
jgi:hypothetical protein